MRIAVFSAKPYDETFLAAANQPYGFDVTFFEPRLTRETVSLANGFETVCVFVNDQLHAATIESLAQLGVRLIALRCSGFNNVDLISAQRHNITVVRVPAYSPHAVAEHTLALILTLNRKIHRAHARVREGNFSLDGLLGFDLYKQTVGIIGTGKIGIEAARIMRGFGCQVLAYDVFPNQECEQLGVRYVDISELLGTADIVTLHCPLTPKTHHLINAATLEQMKTGVMLINTSRGALIDTRAVIQGLMSGKIAYLGLDVYEEEETLFFEDLSAEVIRDDVFARLLTFPNVLITGHQGFFTRDALQNIAETTMTNIATFARGQTGPNVITAESAS
ncbi:MAG: 2-hydroxyacid dehydrogenase [Chloroflexales bacterium]|nr:2-hydroxyacid dehydrogenase [Chloroflexales bacterium]